MSTTESFATRRCSCGFGLVSRDSFDSLLGTFEHPKQEHDLKTRLGGRYLQRHAGTSFTQKYVYVIYVYMYTQIHDICICIDTHVFVQCILMYVFIFTYIHACMHTYINTYIDTYIHTWIHAYMHTYIHT